MEIPEALRWAGETLLILDQTSLPEKEIFISAENLETVAEAICSLRVRGAPAIGIAAAYGVVIAARKAAGNGTALLNAVETAAGVLGATRPTAVNLFAALDRMRAAALKASGSGVSSEEFIAELEKKAVEIHEEDKAMCRAIGEHGLELFPDGCRVLTHCNAGALATGGMGTALAPLYLAHEQHRRIRVYADETRPLLQGARLTAYELHKAGMDVTVLCDGAAGELMRQGLVDIIVTGADRIAANGDTANKIGTYGLAVLAEKNGIPFYIAAPTTTFDLSMESASGIIIEYRDGEELRRFRGMPLAPLRVPAWNPAFDVTPAELITGFITDRGILRPPYPQAIIGLQ